MTRNTVCGSVRYQAYIARGKRDCLETTTLDVTLVDKYQAMKKGYLERGYLITKRRDPRLPWITPFRGNLLAVLVPVQSSATAVAVVGDRHRLNLEVLTNSDECRASRALERAPIPLGCRTEDHARCREIRGLLGQVALSLQGDLHHRGRIEEVHLTLFPGMETLRCPCPLALSTAVSRTFRELRVDVYSIAPGPMFSRQAYGQCGDAEGAGTGPV